MNKFLIKRFLTAVLVSAFLLTTPVYAEHAPFGDFGKAARVYIFKPFLRTELFFGTAKPDGSTVSADEWQKFLADEVTPRFPEGFTVLEGSGQFRDENGRIIREKSFVLIVLYPSQARKSSRRKIEEIRKAYLKAFEQQSVLRVDFPQAVQVSF